MPQICLYFHLHQPYRLRPYSIFDIDSADYFSNQVTDDNKVIFDKVCEKSYIPMFYVLQECIDNHPDFKFSLSITGIFLEQLTTFRPDVLVQLQKLVKSGKVEILAETYYHSLASLYSEEEFRKQVKLHTHKIQQIFEVTPTSFRNTELIYSDHIGWLVGKMKFEGMLTEAVDRYLDGRAKTQLFSSNTDVPIPLLLKHAQLSDDIAFRFSESHRSGQPLTAETFVHWINAYDQNEYVNLFMDFETFGEHQWADTGIFDFFRHFVSESQKFEWNSFVNPTQVFRSVDVKKLPKYVVPEPISWADIDRDLSAWRDNKLQWDSLRLIYDLEKQILSSNNQTLIEDWRKLQASDHFYYMCIKWSADGDVHSYFSPYDSPMDAYNRYSTVLADLQGRLLKLSNKIVHSKRDQKQQKQTKHYPKKFRNISNIKKEKHAS